MRYQPDRLVSVFRRKPWNRGLWLLLCGLVLLGLLLDAGLAQDTLSLDDKRSRGRPDAPVVIIEYSDFTCGYCRKFFMETWPRLREKYVDTGKVRFVYRDYPRADRGIGVDAAQAARCAGDQGQYWAMHDRMFGGGRLGDAQFKQHARDIGLDVAAFSRCQEERPHKEEIFRDKAEALQWGFRGTPGFILMLTDKGRVDVEGEPAVGLPGAFPFEVFDEQVEELLAKSS